MGIRRWRVAESEGEGWQNQGARATILSVSSEKTLNRGAWFWEIGGRMMRWRQRGFSNREIGKWSESKIFKWIWFGEEDELKGEQFRKLFISALGKLLLLRPSSIASRSISWRFWLIFILGCQWINDIHFNKSNNFIDLIRFNTTDWQLCLFLSI